MYEWGPIFRKHLKFKKPFILNGHHYYNKPSEDGTLPDDFNTDDAQLPVLFDDDSSDDPDTEEELRKAEEKEAKKNKPPPVYLTPEEREEVKRKEEERRRYPLAVVPDESKFDKIFILPLFCKPGKHHYMIKYKDLTEPKQAHWNSKIKK
jgi:hypothetical protein